MGQLELTNHALACPANRSASGYVSLVTWIHA